MPPLISPLSHRRVDLVPETAGAIAAVAPGSFGADLGLRAGDRIVAVDGEPLVDALEFQTRTQGDHVVLEIAREDRRESVELDLEGDEYWGITFADPTFDGVLLCENACPFCFIKQIPRGMRRSLYVMDDDYRYSMLYGSFVTLTNLTEDDWRRIEEDRLGPLHVSVHSTNPDLRVELVGNPKAANIMEDLGRLERAGIEFHAQLVLCPGVNDGEEMDRSLSDLATFANCRSVAGVPVGLTRYGLERQSKQIRSSRVCMRSLPHRQIEVRRYRPEEAEAVIAQAESWQSQFRQSKGMTFFLLGDEFYLMCGQPVPPARHYDGFPQIEDGIGITRHFLQDLDRLERRADRTSLVGATGTVVCGTLIAPTMQAAVERFNQAFGASLHCLPLENRFFGPEINISGLLTGADLVAAVTAAGGVGPVYISGRMVSDRTGTMLDDMHVEDASRSIARPVIPANLLSEVARDLRRRQSRSAA